MRRFVALAVLMLLLSGVSAAPAQAITFGTLDGNAHPWVGALAFQLPSGDKDLICSGTLVAPTVFVTAAHCTEYLASIGVAPGAALVMFDSAFAQSATFYQGTYHSDPLYGTAPKSNYHDLAVVVLNSPITGITPARLPAVGLLDQPGVRDLTFTAVGYGEVRNEKTAGPHSGFYDGQRRYVSQTYQSATDTVVTFSMQPSTGNGGTCYGDSGGPHFVGASNMMVAITITGDRYCRSTDKDYRIDTVDSLAFINSFMP